MNLFKKLFQATPPVGDLGISETIFFPQQGGTYTCTPYCISWLVGKGSDKYPHELWDKMIKEFSGTRYPISEFFGASIYTVKETLKQIEGVEAFIPMPGAKDKNGVVVAFNYAYLESLMSQGYGVIWEGFGHAYAARRIQKSRLLWMTAYDIEVYDPVNRKLKWMPISKFVIDRFLAVQLYK